MDLLGVHHVSLNVDNAERTGQFYVDVLGLEPIARPDLGVGGVWFGCRGTQVHLVEVGADHRAPDGQHVAFEVADLDEARQSILGHGIEITEPMDLGAGKQAFLSDPAGNLIELNQPT